LKKERSDAGKLKVEWSRRERKWREDESKKVEYEGEYIYSLHSFRYFCGHT